MKDKRIDLRASPEICEAFEECASRLGHTRSSLLVALMDGLNRHMKQHGELTFPVEFASKRDKMLIHLGEIYNNEIAKDRPPGLGYKTSQPSKVAETGPVMEAFKEGRGKRK